MNSPMLTNLLFALVACAIAQEPLTVGPRIASSSYSTLLSNGGGRDIAFINLTEHVENWVLNRSVLENQTVSWWSLFGNSFVNATASVTPLSVTWDPQSTEDSILDTNGTSNPVVQKVYWFHNSDKTNVTCTYVEEMFPVAWVNSSWSREAKLVLNQYLRYNVPRSPTAERVDTHIAEFDENNSFGAISATSLSTTFHTGAIISQSLEPSTSVKWELIYPRRHLVHNWNMKYCFKGTLAVQYRDEPNVTYYPVAELADDGHFTYNGTTDCLLYTEQGSFTANDTIGNVWSRLTVYPLLSNATTDSRCSPSSSNSPSMSSMPAIVVALLLYVLIERY